MPDISKITLLDGVTYDIKDAYAREHSGVTVETDTIGSASAGDPITVTQIASWNAGSAPTLGTAIPADDITSWNTNVPTSASVVDGIFRITPGSEAALSYTAKSIPNVTSVGTAPSMTKEDRTIPNISVASKTVVTGITGGVVLRNRNGR